MRIKVFSLYGDTISDPSNVVPALLTVLVGSFGNASPAGEAVQLVDAFGAAFTAGAAIPTSDRQGAPKAYLQYIVFNKNMTMAQHGHIMVDPTQKGSWQKMEMEVPIEENGYIYIYVANESLDNVAVYFDDMEVQLIDAPTTNASDYYPFGLAMTGRSYSSEKYRFGYQGQFAELDEETGWNSFELRMYTSVIGRWMAVDPARQYYSAYLGMGNNPITRFDPDGRFDEPKNWFQRTWNSVTFRGGLNKHNSIKVHRVLSPSEIKQFDEMQLTGTLNGVKTFDGRGEFRKFGIFPSPPDGAGFEANFFIGPGGAISIDRIQDAAGGNDLYLSISGGGGADISADFHANYYTNGTNPKPQSIVGLSYFGVVDMVPLRFKNLVQ
ncbi:MAG: RHS repeat-associated core domain-containing protein [Cyclobacteriaceae bacterium]|nr:RHS repeat-associated core domain-containing protein [Cyclobacteriaceae bacterium]